MKYRPGMGANPAAAAGRAKKPAKVALALPEVVQLDASEARPSVLLIGGSGTGKTHAISRLLNAGLHGLVVAAEAKMQELARYNANVMFLGAPVQEGTKKRPPTAIEVYERLMMFRDALGEGEYRQIDGKPLDFIAWDGFLEIGDVIYRYWKEKKPVSKTGEQNTYAMWDSIAEKSVDFFKSVRDAAGMASELYGMPPVGMVATIGEHVERSKEGVTYDPLFPGRKAPELLPYQFEQVIRLSVRNVDGEAQYVMHTVGQNDPDAFEKFFAKTPAGLFPDQIINPDFADVYAKLAGYYKDIREDKE